jgi:hypothetical protein
MTNITLAREVFQTHFVFDSHVVAEEHHVEPGVKRLGRFGRRVETGHRDQREIHVRCFSQRAGERARRRPRHVAEHPGTLGRAARLERPLRRLPTRARGLVARGDHRDHEIRRARGLALAGEEPGLVKQRSIRGRGHHGGRARHARHDLHLAAQAHEGDGVVIGAMPDAVENGQRGPPSRQSAHDRRATRLTQTRPTADDRP